MPKTWAGQRDFHYTGSVETGTEIVYGKGWKSKVSVQEYIALRRQFMGLIVPIDTSRTDPPIGSLGEWLQINVTFTQNIASVAPILVIEE